MIGFVKDLLCSQKWYWLIGAGLVLFELLFNVVIVSKVPYTEIDWIAYMQEVAGVFKEGHWDYKLLRGDTGPLVYPAGFVYLYYGLYVLTDAGINIRLAQWVFVGLHVSVVLFIVLILKQTERFPPWLLV